MRKLSDQILNNEEWLINRVIYYAKEHNYVKYFSAVKQAWSISVTEVSRLILTVLQKHEYLPELSSDDDYIQDSIGYFGLLQANKHREREINLEIFLGVIKYFRQSYIDLVWQADFELEYKERCRLYLDRIFDRIEISFCANWLAKPKEERHREVQSNNQGINKENNKYLVIYESLPNPVIFLNKEKYIDTMNRAAIDLFQYSRDTGIGYYGKNKKTLSWLHEEITSFLVEKNKQIMFEKRLETQKESLWFQVELKKLDDIYDEFAGIIIILENITKRKRAEEELLNYQLLAEHAWDIILFFRHDGRIMEGNKAAVQAYGYTREELLTVNLFDLRKNDIESLVAEQMKQADSSGILFETVHVRKDGSSFPVEVSSQGAVLGKERVLLSVVRDITERKEMEEKLKHLSLHDALTGLYNRAYFEQEMRRYEKGRYNSVSLIVCDVDGLKFVNDTLGHDVGDELLVAAAEVIKSAFREGDMVARIGGDEFAVLLPDSDYTSVEHGCQRIKAAIERYNKANTKLSLSISIGFAIGNKSNINMKNLFKEADNNMYKEKLHQRQSSRSTIVKTLMKALEARDFITEGHAERLENLVGSLAEAVGLEKYRITDMRLLARFHDIGKVGIPDRILFKPGPLTPEEFKEMNRHSEIGYRIAQVAPDLADIADWILKHHEWWNGKGYPQGLCGTEIPVECRILAIVDAYDTMVSGRPYRKPISHKEAVDELKRCAGTQFDPQLVEKFVHVIENSEV